MSPQRNYDVTNVESQRSPANLMLGRTTLLGEVGPNSIIFTKGAWVANIKSNPVSTTKWFSVVDNKINQRTMPPTTDACGFSMAICTGSGFVDGVVMTSSYKSGSPSGCYRKKT